MHLQSVILTLLGQGHSFGILMASWSCNRHCCGIMGSKRWFNSCSLLGYCWSWCNKGYFCFNLLKTFFAFLAGLYWWASPVVERFMFPMKEIVGSNPEQLRSFNFGDVIFYDHLSFMFSFVNAYKFQLAIF